MKVTIKISHYEDAAGEGWTVSDDGRLFTDETFANPSAAEDAVEGRAEIYRNAGHELAFERS